MAAAPALAETEAHRLALRTILDEAVTALHDDRSQGGAVRMAGRLGVAKSTISGWLSGDRPVSFVAVFEALRTAARLNRPSVPRLLEVFAEQVLGVTVRVVLADAEPVADFLTESGDVDMAKGDLVRAMRSDDRDATLAAAREYVRQAEQAAQAAVLSVAR
jgi:transcriptional regulator with XRE-family HTH domain